jgi:hypothetical protein
MRIGRDTEDKDFLRQDYTTPADFESSVSSLMELYKRLTQE